jgi:hypothetical protein
VRLGVFLRYAVFLGRCMPSHALLNAGVPVWIRLTTVQRPDIPVELTAWFEQAKATTKPLVTTIVLHKIPLFQGCSPAHVDKAIAASVADLQSALLLQGTPVAFEVCCPSYGHTYLGRWNSHSARSVVTDTDAPMQLPMLSQGMSCVGADGRGVPCWSLPWPPNGT